ncbi:MAG: family 78 glycoside hydrolase catalytic domain [Deferribacteres bacterium]|nr:family 78 glycoside hydrolase catalytic domain [Deferribacteres bacterium]
MANSRFIIILLFVSACSRGVQEKPAAEVFFENHEARWLHDGRELPAADSLYYLDRPAPFFRREFTASQAIKSARLYITAAGYYRATMNGMPVGRNVLDPAWTDYSKRIYYTEYDVTSLVKDGSNCLGVILGNGFYNPLPLRKWGHRNLRTDTSVGKPTFLAKLFIEYESGKLEEIVSDTTWKYAFGPIVKNSVYLGVVYDARKEIAGWNVTGFDDQEWQAARISQAPGGELQKAFFPPVQIAEKITPREIYSPEPGLWIVDMGVNFTGTYKIKLSGNRGDTVTFRFGERIYDDGKLNPLTSVIGQIKRDGIGGPGAPKIAWQTDSYIIGDRENAWFKPEFTYHAYRYMEIAGMAEKPHISDIQGLALHSNVIHENTFSCSSELLNSIQKATERTFLSNLVSVQSDCPAREKFGYGGDINATSESYIYNFDMQDMYRKTIYDWVDAINDSSFVDTAPFVGIKYCGISWESAYLITQYYLYLYYNDTAIIEELYAMNNQWMDKVARIHPNGIVDQGLSDHESLEPVPVQLTGTGHYLQCARIMKTFAFIMGDEAGEEKYGALTDKLKHAIKTEFWDKPATEKINRQTLFSALLYHGIVPPDQIESAKDSLLQAVKNGPSSHFSTGIFGTKYILETLSEHVSSNIVFDIVNSTAYPGWGFMIDQGATTIWETWEESDNTFSNNHPMFGTVSEWFYRWLGGIRPDPEYPGFKEFVLAPSTPDELDFVNCTYHSPYGKIVSNWKRESAGIYCYEMTVPEGSLARVRLQHAHLQRIEIKEKHNNIDPEDIKGLQTGQFKLSGGDYFITVYAEN